MHEADIRAAAFSELLGITEYTELNTVPINAPRSETEGIEDDEVEEGEIVTSKPEFKAMSRKIRKARKKAEKHKAAADQYDHYIERALGIIYEGDHVKLHRVQKSSKTLKDAQEIEVSKNAPLNADDPEFKALNTTWIFRPGIHIGINNNDQVVFAVRITPWRDMKSKEKSVTQANLGVLMDWSSSVHDIKNNGASKGPKLHGDRGIKDSASGQPRQYGIMAGVGWHRSFDPATDVGFYAVKPGKEEIYNACLDKLPGVAQEYRDRLLTLLPHAGRQIISESMESGIPSFDMVSLDEGTTPQRPFANSLTLTHNDFANYLHTDRDHIPIAYGMWWVSKREQLRGPFQFHPQADHYRIAGGSFFWGEYNIGVNFSKAAGLVEIFWRGQKDFHCTMQSQSTSDMTRWGTSVQITGAGVQAIARFNSSKDSSRVRNAGEKQKQMVKASKKRQRTASATSTKVTKQPKMV